MSFEVRPTDAHVLYDLRRRVLRGNDPEKNVADPRDTESTTVHFGGFVEGKLVVSSSWFPSTSPFHDNASTVQLRYFATDFDYQRHGYGARLMAHAEAWFLAQGTGLFWANGRDTALDFYRRVGWQLIAGSEHLSPETGLPHTVIYKWLREEGGAAH